MSIYMYEKHVRFALAMAVQKEAKRTKFLPLSFHRHQTSLVPFYVLKYGNSLKFVLLDSLKSFQLISKGINTADT